MKHKQPEKEHQQINSKGQGEVGREQEGGEGEQPGGVGKFQDKLVGVGVEGEGEAEGEQEEGLGNELLLYTPVHHLQQVNKSRIIISIHK